MVRPDHLAVRHAASPDAFPQAAWQEGLMDKVRFHPVSRRVECGRYVFRPACRGPPEAAGLQA